ncbi:MAG: uracil-DNA glycosylase [Candidatus Cloacimonetes bacterium]|nr:uracil-DNA glycosylase [Candidatus Cloacimonadota bacterium]
MQNKSIKQYLEYLHLSGIQDVFIKPKPKINKSELLKTLEEKYNNCSACALHKGRNKFCYGNGNADAKLLIIGEAPGADEDRKGEVFVGRSGQLLTKMLQAINLSRDEVYITNIVKCRPPENRNPNPDEKRSCLPYLEEQISIIQPELILMLGKVAAETLLGVQQTLTVFRQKTHIYKGLKTFVSYHPSALLRNPNWKKFAWIDLQNLQKEYRKN